MQVINRMTAGEPVAVAAASGSATPLPQPLVIASGVYSYNAPIYDMRVDGLYRFAHLATPGESWNDSGQRIVYSGDIHALMCALAGCCTHGTSDEGLSISDKTWKARTGWLRLRCGYADQWVRAVVQSVGLTARSVSAVTMETPNGADDGHVMTEVWDGGQWRLYCTDTKRFAVIGGATFGTAADIGLGGAAEWSRSINAGPIFDTSPNNVITSYASMTFGAGQAGLDAWTQRVVQAVGIWASDGLCYFRIPAGRESRKAWLLSLSPSYRVVDDHAAWLSMFY